MSEVVLDEIVGELSGHVATATTNVRSKSSSSGVEARCCSSGSRRRIPPATYAITPGPSLTRHTVLRR